MTLLGLDFDNTLVSYDEIFYKVALEKNIIQRSVKPNKIAIRNNLREQGKDEIFTLLQGEIYGNRILEAKPMPGMLEALHKLKCHNIPMVLISHKTIKPYKGPEYNLHKAAIGWLKKHNFFSPDGLDWNKDNISFKETKESKVKSILEQECTHYVDDLPEILNMVTGKTKKILYDPKGIHKESTEYNRVRNWEDVKKIVLESNV